MNTFMWFSNQNSEVGEPTGVIISYVKLKFVRNELSISIIKLKCSAGKPFCFFLFFIPKPLQGGILGWNLELFFLVNLFNLQKKVKAPKNSWKSQADAVIYPYL